MVLLFLYIMLSCTIKPTVQDCEDCVRMNDSNPVGVGETATFTCISSQSKTSKVNRICFWPEGGGSHSLSITPAKVGKSCDLEENPMSNYYTFEHTCNTEINRYTFSIINVTSSDLNIHNSWCCQVQFDLYDFTNVLCRLITKATNDQTLTTDLTRAGAVETTSPAGVGTTSPASKETAAMPGPSAGCTGLHVLVASSWWLLLLFLYTL